MKEIAIQKFSQIPSETFILSPEDIHNGHMTCDNIVMKGVHVQPWIVRVHGALLIGVYQL